MSKKWQSKHLYGYLLSSLVQFHLFFTSLFIFVVLISNIWYFAPEWLQLGISFKHILIMVSFFIPGALLQSTAISLSVAFIVAYGRLQFHREIDAMRMLGFSAYQIFKPLLHYSIFLFFFIFIDAFIIYPISIDTFEEYYAKVLTQYVAVRSQNEEPQILGETLLYVAENGNNQNWLLVENRQGYRLVVWANQAELNLIDDVRMLDARSVNMLAVESNTNGQGWNWISARNFHYPLLFNINTQSYNPYDGLPIGKFIGAASRLWQEHKEKRAPQKERVKEIKKLLAVQDLLDEDRDKYKEEMRSIKKSSRFAASFVSLLFVALLRISHIFLIVGLVILIFLVLEYSQMRRWGLTIIIWLATVVIYWVLFYFISYKLLNLTWNAFTLMIPILAIFIIDGILLYLIIRKRRRWHAKNN